jgi:spore coat polysaccharide biosynthesis protein SpsF
MISKLKEEKLDFVSNVPGRTFPYGMSIEVLNTSFFKSVYKQLNSEFDKEHVTSWIYENQNIGRRFYFKNKKYHNLHNVKLSIDEKKDIELVKKIISLNNYQNSISLSSLNILLDKIDII